jgi:hypothetical protein
MRQLRATFAVVAVALASVATIPLVLAEDDDDSGFSGKVLVGYRSVSTDGSEAKYKQHINLEEGARLFKFNFSLQPPEGRLEGVFDTMRLEARNLGGDPYETVSFSLAKFGKYDFRYSRRASTYFYEDVIVPFPLADVDLVDGGDFHHFDFRRVNQTADLKLDLTRRARLSFGFDRFTRNGASTTTLDLYADEFELDAPIDESFDQYSLAFEYGWDKVTLVVMEQVRDFRNAYTVFLPGSSDGARPNEPPAPPVAQRSALDSFFLDRPYDYDLNSHTVLVTAQPTKKWLLRANLNASDLKLDVDYSERGTGTGWDFAIFDFFDLDSDIAGGGKVEREIAMLDLDATYLINNAIAVVASLRHQTFEQEGAIEFSGDEGTNPDTTPRLIDEAFATTWDYEITGGDAGMRWQINTDLSLAAGLIYEKRDVDSTADEGAGPEPSEYAETTHGGWHIDLGWRPVPVFRVDLNYEDSSYDDPFTLASPTDRQRARLNLRYRQKTGFFALGSYLMNDFENDNSGWTSDYEQARLEAGYRTSSIVASLGYTMQKVDRAIDQLVDYEDDGEALVPVRYDNDNDILTAHLRWRGWDRLTLGLKYRDYKTEGSWNSDFTDGRVYGEYEFAGGYLLRVGYRRADYDDEREFDGVKPNDYEADIVDLALGLSF